MNQAILFNDDLTFDKEADAWRLTGMVSGQMVTIYFHSPQLKHQASIDTCTKYDLEEVTELWLEENELEGEEIHLHI
ncbi:hypothetical protein HR060_17425 [Catenovulum sp. SM1970]|uniref:hypothetical protein n=1 Tax=Marinifaba aquimaris TaxID=2741323 RepID=UPI001573577C|nr:hypothetical protein [Marinifaba aquimaris]NTS78627.1 hypothetical protein [Marinifaba aquimaris]